MDAHSSKDNVSAPGGEGDAPATNTDKPAAQQPSSTAKLRKRTKTGCLTCRKRRIKCGEERPICNNCIKSKRQCEGYNPRVIWKAPIGDWPGHHGIASTLPYHTGSLPGTRSSFNQQQSTSNTPIQPRPAETTFDFANLTSGPIPTNAPAHGATPTVSQDGYSYYGVAAPEFSNALSSQPVISQIPVSGHFQDSNQQNLAYIPETGQSRPSIVPFQPEMGPSHMQYSQQPALLPDAQFTSGPQEYQQQMEEPSPTGIPLQGPPMDSPQEVISPPFRQSISHHNSYTQHFDPNFQPGIPQGEPPHMEQHILQPIQGTYIPAHVSPYTGDGSHPPVYPAQPIADYQALNNANSRSQSIGDTGPLSLNALEENQQYQVLSDRKPAVELLPTGLDERAHTDTKAFEAQLMISSYVSDQNTPTDMLYEAAIEVWDDDYYDVQSDDEEDIDPNNMALMNSKTQRDFRLVMEVYSRNVSELGVRRIDAFVYDNMLDHYHAEWAANPLRNEKTARVFAHFIHATAPMLSIHNRNPLNTSAMFTQDQVPVSQQSFWTYTLPMMALHNQGLLHSILALGSLHIARLQKASITPSLKHYAYALKRIHHAVGNPKKRLQVTTLAATLLLGFYELMTADHAKWSAHLLGAKQLLMETDYAAFTKQAKAMKAEQDEYDKHVQFQDPTLPLPPRPYADIFKSGHSMPDEQVVSSLIGRKLRYDERGHVIEDFDNVSRTSRTPSMMDMSKYEMLQDLFWWYCRQDSYQSMISGNHLFMDYSRWSDCPPRAPIGRADAVFATYDHFLLLLGRITDFVSKDRERKIKAVEALGGQWRPTPLFMSFMASAKGSSGQQSPGQPGPPQGFPEGGPPPGYGRGNPSFSSPTNPQSSQFTGPPPGRGAGPPDMSSMPQSQGISPFHVPMNPTSPFPPPGFGEGPQQRQQQSQTGPPPGMGRGGGSTSGPGFYGMAPSSGRTHMPTSYARNREPTPEDKEQIELDMEAATQAALSEWKQICAALDVFEANLGPAFQPLSAEYHQPLATPFGDARQYRSYEINVIWSLHYMAKIIAMRSHPSLPPAAQVAAAVAAPITAPLAVEIGRIVAGIVPPPPNVPLNPSLGAALISSSVPLFFSGVQYTDSEQRAWLVSRLFDTEARTGFGSAGQIARGCEASWQKAYMNGRGPPYKLHKKPYTMDDVASGRVEYIEDASEGSGSGDHEKRYVFSRLGKLTYAMGILSEVKDLESVDVAGG